MPKHGKHRAIKLTGKANYIDINSINSKLRGNPGKLRSVFSEIRSSVSNHAYTELITSYRDNAFYRLKIFGEPFPSSPSKFKRNQPLLPIGMLNELRWDEALLLHYKSKLSDMLARRDKIVKLVKDDAYDEASTTLDEMDELHGLSMWGYSLRFFLRNRRMGEDANNSVYSDLRNTAGINGLTYFLLFYLGFRTSPGSTVQHIREQVPGTEDVGEALSLYIGYKLTPFSYTSSSKRSALVEAMLRHDANSAAFDLFISFQRAICLSFDQPDIPITAICASATRLAQHLPTPQLIVARAIAHPDSIEYDTRTDLVLTALDNITLAGFNLEDGLLEALLDALGWTGKAHNGLSQNVHSMLRVLAERNGDRQAAADGIEHLCTTISSLDDGYAIFEISRKLWTAPRSLTLFGSADGIIASGCMLPDIVEFVDDDQIAQQFLDALRGIYGDRPSIALFEMLRTGKQAALPPALANFVRAMRLRNQGNPQDALAQIAALSDDSSPALNIAALRARLELASGELDDAVTTVAQACVSDIHNWASLPIAELVDAVTTSGRTPTDMLSWALVLDIATVHCDPQYARRRSYAVEDAWESRGVTSPSALVDLLKPSEHRIGIAYLRSLCTPDILSDSDQFLTIRELEEERIRVCQALVELDPDQGEAYLSEIKSITRWLVIYDGLRSVEQSKVYVDVAGLREHLLAVAGAEYERMLALRREKVAIGNVDELFKKEVVKYRDDEIAGNLLLRYAHEDPLKILRYLLITIFKEYSSNSRFGLDVYLSTRIRHGTLKGHLRSPLEDNRLMCQRSGGHYQDQPHWVSRIAEISGGPEVGILQAIRDFSSRIDDDIAELNSRHLRLRSNESPDGWFDFVPFEQDLEGLDRFFERRQPSFSSFLDQALQDLNGILERQLKQVQVQLRFALRPRWAKHLRDLREAVQAGHSSQIRSELDAAIAAAQVSVDLAIDRVASWFALSAAQENPDYTVELAVDIAARSIANCFGNNKLSIKPLDGEGPLLRGSTMASLVDVFFILFENILKHATMGDTAHADVSVARIERFYTITVRNRLENGIDLESLTRRLSSIRESLSLENEERLVTEGGSGYHKLRKILQHDLQVEHDFDFGFSDYQYEVTILLDAEAVLA